MITSQPSSILHSDIYSLLVTQAEQRPWAIALESPGRPPLSYGDLLESVNQLRVSLRQAGVTRKDRVAIVLPNGMDLAIALLAVTSTAVAAPLNPAYVEREFESYFPDINVKYLLAQEGVKSPAHQVANKHNIPVLELAIRIPSGPSIRQLPSQPLDKQPADNRVQKDVPSPDDIALVLLTSGSTGRSKKVPLTHRNICVSVRDICRSVALSPDDRCLAMWEQFHIGGLVDLLLAPLASGGSVICADRFNADQFYDLVEAHKPTWFQGVPATLHELLVCARRRGLETCPSSLRFIRSVAASLSPQLMEEIETHFDVPVIQTFGMTEAAPLITTNTLPPAQRKPGSVGPTCGPEIVIVDEQGNQLGPMETGEVVVRGANVIAGYEGDPVANAHSFRDGWFHTGDTGYLDEDRYLFLRGRIKEMINRGGEKITPQEIDDVLLGHPAVAQAVSFSIPHRILGEDVGVAIVLHEKGSITENDVREYVGERLTEFKIPQQVIFLDEMPLCPIGKVRRMGLAELLNSRTGEVTYAPPKSELEQRLATIWGVELNVSRVGIDDNFFGLGGDSLSGVRTILAIEKALGRPLPIKALFKISTVRQMAAAIESEDAPVEEINSISISSTEPTLSHSDYRLMLTVMASGQIPTVRAGSLVKTINAHGSRPPLFWCFNAPETEMASLAKTFGPEQPLYGLYSGGGQVVNSDESNSMIADHYVKEILALKPEGPYVIGGSCRGGKVATNIAFRLLKMGKTVSHLCLLEVFVHALFDYPGKMLLMYGKQSHRFCYKPFRWGGIGWQTPFRQVPDVEWVSGPHGRFFNSFNVPTLYKKLNHFLKNEPTRGGILSTINTYCLLLIHRIPPLFRLYARLRGR